MTAPARWIVPDWNAPAEVHALMTLRRPGPAPSHVPGQVLDLERHAAHASAISSLLPSEPCWLEQVHGTAVVECGPDAPGTCADAAWTDRPGRVCVVLTADCLPVLLCDPAGPVVAAAHAGWRGLAAGILEATVAAMGCPPGRLLAWLGPAIGPEAFIVGSEVRAAFIAHDPLAIAAFIPAGPDSWHGDLCRLARQRLESLGVDAVSGGRWCTANDPERFYSYRRDGIRAGRHATLIWFDRV